MGVVNVTPDSFSDGGRFAGPDEAVAHALAMLAVGADLLDIGGGAAQAPPALAMLAVGAALLDIGGESTRPGATRPLVAEELARVVPVITALAGHGALV